MKVVQFIRKPGGEAFSIRQLFEDVRKELPADIDAGLYTNPYPSRGFWRRLAGMFRAARYQGDVNHITGDIHYLNILMRRRKTILTVLDCITLERLHGLKYRIFRFFWYWLPARRSAVITVISDSTRKELQRHLGGSSWPIVVIPCCVSPEFKQSPKTLDATCPIILQVGTTPNKNLERVSAALKGFRCRLVIIGRLLPSQVEALRENNIAYDNHLGISREELIDHYRSCDIVMFASLYEGFGLPIIEAQAVGRPVITSCLYSMPEVGGGGACYVDPYDVSAIRSAVEKIINNTEFRERLINDGVKNVQKYGPVNIAGKYAELYRAVHRGKYA